MIRRYVMATATFTEAPVATAAPASLPEGVPYRLSADDYFRMVEADIIPSDRRVGLWNGQLYEKMAKSLRHAVAHSLLLHALTPVFPEGWCHWFESPIRADDFSAPSPDLCVVRGHPNDYTRRG